MTEESLPPVSLIIPNFNGADLLCKNLPAVLAAAQQYGGPWEVLVVDDASRDASLQVLVAEFPAVTPIVHERNQGFAAAVHSGVAAAAHDCLILLNSDVRPDPDFIRPLVQHLADPQVFSVTPLVVDGEERPGEESWRCYRLRRGRLRLRDWGARIPPRFVETLFASGGSMAVRKARFNALGGFLPLFQPFYSEDADLGLRAWRRGWRSLLEPASRVIHDHAGSANSTQVAQAFVRRIRLRNRFLLEWLHVPSRDLWRSLVPGYMLQALGRLLRLDGRYFGALASALGLLPQVLKARREIQAQDRLAFWDIMARIERCLDEAMREAQIDVVAGKGKGTGKLVAEDSFSASRLGERVVEPPLFTLFIPTFNRAHLLPRALASIEAQTCRDFEVVIVDDGSTDGTADLIREWRARVDFPVVYRWQENQGKYVAHNLGVELARGRFFFLLDSDDRLLPGTLERLLYHWETIPPAERRRFAGVEGLIESLDGHRLLTHPYPQSPLDVSFLDLQYRLGVGGDKKRFILTEILKDYPYPLFPREKNIRDSLTWNRMALRYVFRCVNESFQQVEYQPDGLTSNRFAIRMGSPRGFGLCCLEEVTLLRPWLSRRQRRRSMIDFIRYALHSGTGLREQARLVAQAPLWYLLLPAGMVRWLGDLYRLHVKGGHQPNKVKYHN